MKLIDLSKISLIAVIAATINPIQVNANPIIESEEKAISQNNSVSQLRDVEPKDWAYEALKSLVEKYECIQGNAQGFYLGNRSITRYEFATGLNTCLEKITQLITTGEAIQEDDLSKIKQLQTQFSSELTALSTRLDSIENRILPLEGEQFSTTTKLSGTTWINLTGVSTGDNIKFEALPNTPFDNRFIGGRDGTGKPLIDTISDSKTTLSSLTWLTLNTSFTGKDILKLQLAAGNGASPINQFASAGFFNTYGSPFTDQTPATIIGKPDIVIRNLAYSFPVTDAVKLTIGPRVNWFSYFDFNSFTYFLTGAGSYVSTNSTQGTATGTGSGGVLEWKINPQLIWKGAYLGENIAYLPSEFGYNTASNPSFGLFGGTNSSTSELTYSPTNKLNLRLRYTYTRLQGYGGQVGGGNAAPLPYGYLDASPGFSVYDSNTGTVTSGGLDHANAHTFAFNFDWLLNPKLGIFGRYSYGNINLEPIDQTVNVQSWQMGMAFPDLGKKGGLGVLTFVAPMDIQKGRQYFVSGGGDGGKIYELEASYFYPFNDNIALVPSFYAVFNPNNFNSNPNIYVSNLRMQFSF